MLFVCYLFHVTNIIITNPALVSIPIDRDTNIEERVKDLRLHEEKPLWPLKILLKTFIDLDEETLHVVVKAPPIREHRYLFLSVIPLIQIIVR
jgi:hypothetical protein